VHTGVGAGGDGKTAVERMWHIPDSQGQILALYFRQKSLKSYKLFPPRSAAVFKSPLSSFWKVVARSAGVSRS